MVRPPRPNQKTDELEKYRMAFPSVSASLKHESEVAFNQLCRDYKIPTDEIRVFNAVMTALLIYSRRKWARLQ